MTPPAATGKNAMPGSNRMGDGVSDAGCLYPVVLRVPPAVATLPPRARVATLSRLARLAVRWSAHLSSLPPPPLAKDDQGAPRPAAGVHWSITHKPAYVAGVVATSPVGIDIERIRPPAEGLYAKIATEQEWRLDRRTARDRLFYRFWTAKEAVLKAEGLGLRGLARCRVTAVDDPKQMMLAFDRQPWRVAHLYLPGHVAALTRIAARIHWRVDPAWPPAK
jgi:4'-phosphopantetheinyl transferase